MDQPSVVINPAARGQLNGESVSSRSPVSRDGFGRPILRQPAHSPHLG